MNTPATLNPRQVLAAAGLCALAWPALAQDPAAVAALVYGGGEAISPQAETQLRALQLPAAQALTRAEVREQLLQAQADGTLGAAGELADRPTVLLARVAANDRQTRQLLAAREAAEREALRLAEAAREAAQREAEQRAQAAAADTPTAAATDSATAVTAAAPALDTAAAPAPADAPPAAPTDAPRPAPTDSPIGPAAPATQPAPARLSAEDDEG